MKLLRGSSLCGIGNINSAFKKIRCHKYIGDNNYAYIGRLRHAVCKKSDLGVWGLLLSGFAGNT